MYIHVESAAAPFGPHVAKMSEASMNVSKSASGSDSERETHQSAFPLNLGKTGRKKLVPTKCKESSESNELIQEFEAYMKNSKF